MQSIHKIFQIWAVTFILLDALFWPLYVSSSTLTSSIYCQIFDKTKGLKTKYFENRMSDFLQTGTKSDGGGTCEKNLTWCQNCPLQMILNQAIFNCYFKHRNTKLFKVLLSLKLVRFDTKMYLNFSNFLGQISAGGGQALVQKRGQLSNGGIGKIFVGWGDSQSPPEKKPDTPPSLAKNKWLCIYIYPSHWWC